MKSIRIPDLGLRAVSCLLLIPIFQSGSCLATQDDWKDQTRELLTQLETANESEARRICQQFAGIGIEAREAAPVLLSRMQNRNQRYSPNCSDALASLAPEIVPELQNALHSGNLKFRQELMFTIRSMGHDAAPFVPEIVAMLEHPDDDIRRVAIETLGELAIEPDIVVPALMNRLDSSDRFDAANAARAIGNFGESAKEASDSLAEMALRIPQFEVKADCYACRMALFALEKVDPTGEKLLPVVTRGLLAKDCNWRPDGWSFASDSLEILYRRPVDYQQAEANLLTLLKSKEIRKSIYKYKPVAILLARLRSQAAWPILLEDMHRELVADDEDDRFWLDDETPEFYFSTLIRVSAARSVILLDPGNVLARKVLLEYITDQAWSITIHGVGNGSIAMNPKSEALYGLSQLQSLDEESLAIIRKEMASRDWSGTPFARAFAWTTACGSPESCKLLATQDLGDLYDFDDEISPADAARILGPHLDQSLTTALIEGIFLGNRHSPDFNVRTVLLARPDAMGQIVEHGFGMLEHPVDWPREMGRYLSIDTIQLELRRLAGNFDIKFGMLESALRSENVNCRKTAIQMLGIARCDDERVVPALIAALDDERAIVRMRAAGALGKYGAKSIAALPRLKESLNDDYYAVRTAAEAAVVSIDPSPSK